MRVNAESRLRMEIGCSSSPGNAVPGYFFSRMLQIPRTMRIVSILLIICVFILFAFTGCKSKVQDQDPDNGDIQVIDYSCVGSYPHDTTSFTEGFLISNDSLFESTGSPLFLTHGGSIFGPVDLTTGKISVRVELDKEEYFGEGIAYLNGKFYQLTYTNKIGFIYDAATYEVIGQFDFMSDEGWGLTSDGESLIMSDGTDVLTYIDPQNFLVKRILPVTEKGIPKHHLNELEFINGYIYANIWLSTTIVKIDTSNGKVAGLIDLIDLIKEAKIMYSGAMEMNGIAYDPDSETIFITGKLWPKIFEIELIR